MNIKRQISNGVNKKVLISTILFAIVLVFSFAVLSKNKTNNGLENKIILFYGDGCPHCLIVEEYIKKNDIESRISFLQKEVYYHKGNQKELFEKAKLCGIPENYIGVPLLWDGETLKCFVGDREIIEFFEQKTNQ